MRWFQPHRVKTGATSLLGWPLSVRKAPWIAHNVAIPASWVASGFAGKAEEAHPRALSAHLSARTSTSYATVRRFDMEGPFKRSYVSRWPAFLQPKRESLF